jgi:uncharacterized radical SAM superfamily Fe-S cluster-containing enzyme
MTHQTPSEITIRPADIPRYLATRTKSDFQGCTQVNQIFLKADGKISCSCMRYYHILADVRDVDVGVWFDGQIMQYIRDSYKAGSDPFSFCANCISRLSSMDVAEASRNVNLHIEPSSNCNLYCSECTCTHERQSTNAPARSNLDFGIFEKMLVDLERAGKIPSAVAFVGFGEPLFNSALPAMSILSREMFPKSHIYIDTNANFGPKRAVEIANCGLNEIRLGIDGSSQETYMPYRVSGSFEKTFAFATALANEIRRTGSATRVIWKYILFRHNDTDDSILSAAQKANDIGAEFQIDRTYGEWASKRSLDEVSALLGNSVRISSNCDPAATVG